MILINDNVQDIDLSRTQGGGQDTVNYAKSLKKGGKRLDHDDLNLLSLSSMKTACLIEVKKNADRSNKKLGFFRNTLQHVPEKCIFFRCRFPVWLHSEKFLNELGSIKQPV